MFLSIFPLQMCSFLFFSFGEHHVVLTVRDAVIFNLEFDGFDVDGLLVTRVVEVRVRLVDARFKISKLHLVHASAIGAVQLLAGTALKVNRLLLLLLAGAADDFTRLDGGGGVL